MRLLLVLLIGLVLSPLAFAQGYTPKDGETVLRLFIEDKGDIYILLYTKEAPKTTARIIELVGQKFYDGQRFYKVVRSPKPFIAMVGDPASREKKAGDPSLGNGKTGQSIPYENSGKSHVTGAVGLATLENQKDTGDCQFYICLAPAKFLDGNYTVFGQVVSGGDVLQKLQLGDRIRAATIQRG